MMFNEQHKDDALRFSLSEHGTGFGLGRYFVLVEMASKDGSDIVLVHPALIVLLNQVRAHFNTAVSINSGYRSPEHNRSIGGANQSRHVWGMAADLHVWDVEPKKVAEYFEGLNVGGLKAYSTFTHVDVEGINRRW